MAGVKMVGTLKQVLRSKVNASGGICECREETKVEVKFTRDTDETPSTNQSSRPCTRNAGPYWTVAKQLHKREATRICANVLATLVHYYH